MDTRQGLPHRCAKCPYSTTNFARYKHHLSTHYNESNKGKGYGYIRASIFSPHKTARIPLDAIRSENQDPRIRNIRHACKECNYSCSAKHILTKHINSCHTEKSSPVRKYPSKQTSFPPTPIDPPSKKEQSSPKPTNPKRRRLSSSSSSSSSNTSKAKRLMVTVPRKTPEEEKNQKTPSTTIPTSNEDSRKSPSPNTQLVKVEVHVYIHRSPTNTTAVSTSTTDLGAGINNTLNLSLTPSEQEALLD